MAQPSGPGDNPEYLVNLSLFSSIGKSIVAENSIKGVLDRVMEHVGRQFGPDNWSILLMDAEGKELIFSVVVGRAAAILQDRRVPLDEGVAGWVATNKQALTVDPANADPRFSPRFDRITGFDTESIVAVPLLSGDKVFGVIELLNRLDGKPFSAYDLCLLSTIADFSALAIEKAYYLAELRRLSEVDPLTNVLNRRGLAKVIGREEARIKRHPGPISVIVADVDEFKKINDRFGHQAGDEVLVAVARALLSTVRTADTVARYGGDEFVIVMPSTEASEAEAALARFTAAIGAEAQKSAIPFKVTLGVHSSDTASFDELFRESDRDLYRHKGGPLAIEDNLREAMRNETEPAP